MAAFAAITPTLTAQRWGPDSYQVFDYKAHPIRDLIDDRDPTRSGNPCLVFRHGGGQIGGCYREAWIINGGAVQPYNKLFNYLLESAREIHFDIVSLESGQVRHTDVGGGNGANPNFSPSKKMYFLEALQDYKRGVAAVKAWGAGFANTSANRMNPTKFITMGHSAGAVTATIAMMTPPIVYPNKGKTAWSRATEANAFDSTSLGTLSSCGQIDFRNKNFDGGGAVDYLLWSNQRGYFGTRDDDAHVEWDAIPAYLKDTISLRAYLENGDTQYYTSLFNHHIEQGNGVLPLANSHDSRQLRDLNQALQNARRPDGRPLPYAWALSTNAQDGSIISDSQCEQMYRWMAELVKQSTQKASTGAIR